MSWSFNRILPAIILVAIAQSGVLGWMVYDRVHLLTTGKEIVLPVIPVDPRSLFRGDYVRLGYAISSVAAPSDAPKSIRRGTLLYVTIAKDASDAWAAIASSAQAPRTLKPGQLVLRGRTARNWHARGGRMLRMRYGIEAYFVQEGRGPALEKQAREKQLAALISVDASGQAAIKGLMIDGKRSYIEPLF